MSGSIFEWPRLILITIIEQNKKLGNDYKIINITNKDCRYIHTYICIYATILYFSKEFFFICLVNWVLIKSWWNFFEILVFCSMVLLNWVLTLSVHIYKCLSNYWNMPIWVVVWSKKLEWFWSRMSKFYLVSIDPNIHI